MESSTPLTSVEGQWEISVCQSDSEIITGILAINKKGETLDPTFTPSPAASKWVIEESDIEPTNVSIDFAEGEIGYSYTGTLQGRTVLGYFLVNGNQVVPGRMVLTRAKTVAEGQTDQTYPRSEQLKKILEMSQPLGAALDFLKADKTDPLDLYASEQLLQRLPSLSLSDQEVKAFIDLSAEIHAAWGDPLLARFYRQAAMMLATAGLDRRLLTDLVRKARERFPEGTDPELDETFQLTLGVSAIVSSDPALRAEGAKQLEAYHSKHPFDPSSGLALAEYALANEKLDEALNRFADLALLPQMEQVVRQMRGAAPEQEESLGTQVLSLWTELKGNSDGLGPFLRERYHSVVTSLAPLFPAKKVTESQNRRNVVCELFTGGGCQPCVAADLALTNLEQIYAPPAFIALRYHEHTAGLDPLVAPFNEARFEYYRTRQTPPDSMWGTPTVVLNGRVTPPLGGMVDNTAARLAVLKSTVEDLFNLRTNLIIELKPLTFENTKYEVKLKGIPNSVTDLRIHGIIAEKLVSAPSRNGIQEHEMLVRGTVTPDEGLPISGTEFSTELSIDREALQAALTKYISGVEKKHEMKFPEHSAIQGGLKLVVLVQNQKTGEILQANIANGP